MLPPSRTIAGGARTAVASPLSIAAVLLAAALAIVHAYLHHANGSDHLITAGLVGLAALCWYAGRIKCESPGASVLTSGSADDEKTGLVRHLLTSREQEKSRIARELHDELGSSLTAVTMDLAWARQNAKEQPALASRLARAAEVLKSTIEMKRRIIQELRPTLLDNLGLNAAIESYTEEFSRRTGVVVKTTVPDDLPVLGEGHPIALFRIFEEALTNVSRHSNATQAEVTLEVRDDALWLTVRDDGIGLRPNASAPGKYGLREMRERALQVGGTVTFGPSAERGTIVEAMLPFSADQTSARAGAPMRGAA